MRDAHIVIRKIYALFPGREQLCAIPIGRQQIERLLIVIALLRKGDDFFFRYKKASLANAYRYFFYSSQETRNLAAFAQGNTTQIEAFREQMLRGVPPFTEEEVKSLEDYVLTGVWPKKMDRPLGPKGMIRELSGDRSNASLVTMLCRLYVEYERLCEFTHTGLSGQSTHAFLGRLEPGAARDHLMRTVTREPVLWISYITMLIAATEVSLHVNNPVQLRATLCDLWEPFEQGHLLGRFVWLKWARQAIGLLDTRS
jgi:hypothetical protein